MLRLNIANIWYARSGLAILLLQISLFVLALKPFHYGNWYQVEPTVLGLFVLSAFNALWLAAGFLKRWLTAQKPIHPLLLCLLVWVGWQWLATLFASVPWRSWFGQPSIGEGAGFYTAMLLSCLLAGALWQKPAYRKIILSIAGVNLLVMAWLHFDIASLCPLYEAPESEDLGMPGNWADYLPFLVGYVWIAFLATPSLRTPSRYAWLVIFSTLIVFHVSGSKTASWLFKMPFIPGGIILWIHVVKRPKWLEPNRFWRILATLGCLLPMAWIGVSESSVWEHYNYNCSLPTRALFNRVSLSTVAHEPERLIIGDGWGRFTDDVFKYALVDGIYTFREGNRTPNWNMVDNHAAHSHNEITETLLALGLPGMLLWLLLPIIAIWTMPANVFWWCMPMLLAVISLQSFWFFLPQVVAYQALMWAVLATDERPRAQTLPGRIPGMLCLALAAVMLWSASEQWNAMVYDETLSHAIIDQPPDHFDVAWLSQDVKRGGDRLRASVVFYGNQVAGKAAVNNVTPIDSRWYLLFLQTAHQTALLPQTGAWLTSMDMWLEDLLFMNVAPSDLDKLKPEIKPMLPEAAICLSKKAPLRDDITAPFLYNLDGFTGGDDKKSVEILQQILAVAPEHRGALWLMGQKLSKMPGQEAEGHAMMQRALDLGVAGAFPLTSQEIRQNIR